MHSRRRQRYSWNTCPESTLAGGGHSARLRRILDQNLASAGRLPRRLLMVSAMRDRLAGWPPAPTAILFSCLFALHTTDVLMGAHQIGSRQKEYSKEDSIGKPSNQHSSAAQIAVGRLEAPARDDSVDYMISIKAQTKHPVPPFTARALLQLPGLSGLTSLALGSGPPDTQGSAGGFSFSSGLSASPPPFLNTVAPPSNPLAGRSPIVNVRSTTVQTSPTNLLSGINTGVLPISTNLLSGGSSGGGIGGATLQYNPAGRKLKIAHGRELKSSSDGILA